MKLLLRSKLEHCNVSKHARLDLDLSLSKRSCLRSRFDSMREGNESMEILGC